MPEWLWGVILGGSGGGIIGYYLRATIDEKLAERKEMRQLRQADLVSLRDALHAFLGKPRAHFTWLESVRDIGAAGGSPSPEAKAQVIADWVYKNAPRFPASRRGPMYLITNIAYQLASGDRSFFDRNPTGYEMVDNAWKQLDEYAQKLTQILHGRVLPYMPVE
jgi:hypothetical protein